MPARKPSEPADPFQNIPNRRQRAQEAIIGETWASAWSSSFNAGVMDLEKAEALRLSAPRAEAMASWWLSHRCEVDFEGTERYLLPMRPEQVFERRPDVCGGQPVLVGTRVPLRTVLASLAEGATIEQVVADFPTVTTDQVRAVIAFAAASAEEDLPVPGVPSVE